MVLPLLATQVLWINLVTDGAPALGLGVDLIKLDVEGAEREALEGARQSLQRYRPKLQISTYHKKDDLFELPFKLMRELPDYRWFIGHHGPWHSDSDLYGMPNERLRPA